MWSVFYNLEDFASCLLDTAGKGLSYFDGKIDNLFEKLKRNKCQVGEYVFAPGEAWKDQDGRIRTCLRGGRVALVAGLDKNFKPIK